MNIKTNYFLNLFLILSLLMMSIKSVHANEYFSDNFNSDNLNNWTFFTSDSASKEGWKLDNGRLVGEINSGQSSFLTNETFNLSDFSLSVDAMNLGGVDQNIVFRVSQDRKKFYDLNIRFNDQYWPQVKGEINLWKFDDKPPFGYKQLVNFTEINKIDLTQNKFHKIKIEIVGSKIKAYFDSVLVVDIEDTDDPLAGGSFGFYSWGGRYGARPTVNVYDNLIVGDGLIETKKPKIIILPGLGASWNTDAIVYDKVVGDNDWEMTPFVKSYDKLVSALKENGLEQDKDFYIWNYDWRRPISEIETKLNSFIDEKISNKEKVALIGHSLGGLVARIWAEDNKDDLRLKKVLDLGSPNLGAVDAYEVWNGGQISNLKNIDGITSKILLKIKGLSYKTNMEAVRNNMPIIKDLLPTFDFVSKKGIVLTNDKLESKNSFLLGKNNTVGIGTSLKLFVGNGFNTVESVKLKDNNVFDKFLGIWPDGRIDKFTYSNSGDGTVLIKSANYGKSDFTQLNSNHGEIVNNSVNLIMSEIGLSQTSLVGENQNWENNLVFFVGSPADYSVKCDNENSISDQDGFVILKNNNYKSCEIKLVGTGDGIIHVVTGNTNNNGWVYWEKNIKEGEIYVVDINPVDGQIINNANNTTFLKSIIREDINSLIRVNISKDLKEALKFLEKDKPVLVIKNIFEFRKNNKEKIISEKIIENTTKWMPMVNKCSKVRSTGGLKIVKNYQNLINNLMNLKNSKEFKLNEDAAISYQKMDKFLEESKNNLDGKNYDLVCAENLAALGYGNEVLFRAHKKNDFGKWLLQDSDL